MNSVWCGSIDLEIAGGQLHHVQLQAPQAHVFEQWTTLQLLSIVRTAAVPLYLAAGPSLSVCLEDIGSERLLHNALSRGVDEGTASAGEDSWTCSNGQSRFGLLLRPIIDKNETTPTRVTEILIYATTEPNPSNLPSPPASSSPIATSHNAVPPSLPQHPSECRFHALPLCSNVLRHTWQASGLCTPPPESSGPFFLPNNLVELEAAIRKQKMTSVFDAASQKRRKSKAKGGEGVSKAMASLERPHSQHSSGPTNLKMTEDIQTKPLKTTLVRSSSDGHASLKGSSRTPSLSNGSIARKRSSLRRVESVDHGRESSVLSNHANDTFEQNKAALSKIIMAGMRLHGLQQRKKVTAIDSNLPQLDPMAHIEAADTVAGDDEYKQVYHQTLKSALFAFRAQHNQHLIPQDRLRDLVDRLLVIFCTDPTLADEAGTVQTPAFASNGVAREHTFDVPSSSAAKAEINVWNTPVHKKRKRLDLLDGD